MFVAGVEKVGDPSACPIRSVTTGDFPHSFRILCIWVSYYFSYRKNFVIIQLKKPL